MLSAQYFTYPTLYVFDSALYETIFVYSTAVYHAFFCYINKPDGPRNLRFVTICFVLKDNLGALD